VWLLEPARPLLCAVCCVAAEQPRGAPRHQEMGQAERKAAARRAREADAAEFEAELAQEEAAEAEAARLRTAVAARRLNSRTEDGIRRYIGIATCLATAVAVLASESARHQYGWLTLAVSGGLIVWQTGTQSL
jgi:hypothetical protein